MAERDPFTAALRAELAGIPASSRVRVDMAGNVEPIEGIATVVTFSAWTPAQLAELGGLATTTGVVIPLRCDGAVTILGPVAGPGLRGCVVCAEGARLNALGRTDDPVRTMFRGTPVPATLPALAALVAMIAGNPVAAAETVWTVGGGDAAASAHLVVPRADCPTCLPVPDDDPAAARFVPASRPLPATGEPTGELRQPNAATGVERLNALLVDRRQGPVVSLAHVDGLPLPLGSASTMVNGRREWGYGRDITVARARRTALFEVVERWLGSAPRGRRTVLRAAYDELGPRLAIDPATLGLADPRYDGHPFSRLTPYRPGIPTRWVHGWSLTRGQPVAVPEHVAYYNVPATPDAPHFVAESSNGNGLGNSLEEAALFALFEVAERDAFLMAWYARTPLRRVAIPDDDPLIPHLADTLGELGYDLMFFDATNDLKLPAVISLALREDPRLDLPHAYFAAGAHVHPRAALRSAAQETAVGVGVRPLNDAREAEDTRRERLLRMLADPTEVRTLEDHSALYTLPEARPRYEFLLDDTDPVDWRELWPDRPAPATDLTRVLTGLVAHLDDLGLDTLVVDQTDRWTRERLGLHAAKVIVPGTLPMTFGHVHHRTLNLPRLLEVPYRLGRVPAVPDHADLPLHPHPFP